MAMDREALRRETREGMTPEQRQRVDARAADEARHDETAGEVTGHFARQRLAPPPAPPMRRSALFRPAASRPAEPGRAETVEEWTSPLKVRIESSASADGAERHAIRFIGAVTGYECFELSEDFCARLSDPAECAQRPKFYICGGTPDRYDSCYVERSDVEAYLRERKPDLFPVPSAPRGP